MRRGRLTGASLPLPIPPLYVCDRPLGKTQTTSPLPPRCQLAAVQQSVSAQLAGSLPQPVASLCLLCSEPCNASADAERKARSRPPVKGTLL